ncbi:sulfotransferase 2B1-like [Rhincodon typus]|uniref:sulfotransferase 2B1-like n=1 Tax=Rhincodon typus TaxID=259920 RepID=UPI00202E6E74|nr:sulfotransferase 2B1-like [Rhincodon typus]
MLECIIGDIITVHLDTFKVISLLWQWVYFQVEIILPHLSSKESSLHSTAVPSGPHLSYEWKHLYVGTIQASQYSVVYVSRNPKDALVSSFHYHNMASFVDDAGTFEEFIHKFLEGNVMFGSWFDHVKSWWQRKDQDNILFVTYEELLQDMRSALLKLGEFLGKQLSDDAIEIIVTQTKFNNMRQNKMSNYSFVPKELMDQSKTNFLRKGISGDWKNHFTTAQTEHFNSVYTQEMKGIDFPFYKD